MSFRNSDINKLFIIIALMDTKSLIIVTLTSGLNTSSIVGITQSLQIYNSCTQSDIIAGITCTQSDIIAGITRTQSDITAGITQSDIVADITQSLQT